MLDKELRVRCLRVAFVDAHELYSGPPECKMNAESLATEYVEQREKLPEDKLIPGTLAANYLISELGMLDLKQMQSMTKEIISSPTTVDLIMNKVEPGTETLVDPSVKWGDIMPQGEEFSKHGALS